MLTGFISDHKILTAPKSQNAPATYKIGDCGIAQPFSMPLDKTPKDQADKRTIAATNHQSCQTLMGSTYAIGFAMTHISQCQC